MENISTACLFLRGVHESWGNRCSSFFGVPGWPGWPGIVVDDNQKRRLKSPSISAGSGHRTRFLCPFCLFMSPSGKDGRDDDDRKDHRGEGGSKDSDDSSSSSSEESVDQGSVLPETRGELQCKKLCPAPSKCSVTAWFFSHGTLATWRVAEVNLSVPQGRTAYSWSTCSAFIARSCSCKKQIFWMLWRTGGVCRATPAWPKGACWNGRWGPASSDWGPQLKNEGNQPPKVRMPKARRAQREEGEREKT